jgi:hypothetical protein
MLMFKERRPTIWTLQGWAISVLQEAGAIRECEEHGWMQDRADPHARERGLCIALENPPFDVSPEEAIAAVKDVLVSTGDNLPGVPAGLSTPAAMQQTTNMFRWKCSSLERTRLRPDTGSRSLSNPRRRSWQSRS